MSGSEQYDLVVIGGGAAGFFGAIRTAEHFEQLGKKARIVILERSSQVLQKVKISGGGRCNVTHDCMEPKELVKNYPRGQRTLIGPFHHWAAQDTIAWFQAEGVGLKVEADGRMFPETNTSQTVIDTLWGKVKSLGIEVATRQEVTEVNAGESLEDGASSFVITTKKGDQYQAAKLLVATGGTRLKASETIPRSTGHEMIPAVPSLFTFDIKSPLIEGLEGVSVNPVQVTIVGPPLKSTGPLLVTHWGLSGPAILKLSAQAAVVLAGMDYQFSIRVDWLNGDQPEPLLRAAKQESGKKLLKNSCPFPTFSKRFWARMLEYSKVSGDKSWSQLSKVEMQSLIKNVSATELEVTGKSINKDEFVTAGGVSLKQVNFKTMESKMVPGLHFAGEALDIDGITGGFNFQAAWTTARLAATHIAKA